MRNRIRLDKLTDIYELVEIVSKYDFPITLESSDGFRVNAKSIIGALASMEFHDIWIVSENNLYRELEKFIIVE